MGALIKLYFIMKKLLFTFCLICHTISAQAQLLWKVSGNGLEKPSYIIGTHHLAPLSITDSIAGLSEALTNTSQMIGEIRMDQLQSPENMAIMQQLMLTESDSTIQALVTPEEYEMINAFAKEHMMFDISMIPQIKPSYILNNAVVIMYVKSVVGFNPQEQLDTFFQSLAMNQGKPVSALETLGFQFGLLYNSMSLQRQADLLVCTLSNMDQSLDRVKRLTNAYMKQDLDELYKVSEEKDGTLCDATPEETAALIDNRNINWANELPAMMQEAPAFIAVGALHLPGAKGVLNLLKEKGYQVEPMQ